MPYKLFQTTAENVIAATDAALQKPGGVDENLVSVFLDTTPVFALDALKMARELGLVREESPGIFVPDAKYGLYLCTANREEKGAILRYVLEQYDPYRTFKARLNLSGIVGEAATQARALHDIDAHREVISSTFIDLGTYSQSLMSEGGGLYRPRLNEPKDFLRILNKVIQDRETADLSVKTRLGEDTVLWINGPNVLDNLITAYQRAAAVEQDSSAPIVHAGNAIESFLAQVAEHFGVNVSSAHGINAKADVLSSARQLPTKHKFMFKYLGHVRNATDHGVDPEIGTQWGVTDNTAIEYVHVAQSVITATVKRINGQFTV